MIYVNIITQTVRETLPDRIPETQTFNPTLDMLLAAGWRAADPPPAPASGYERLTVPTWVQDGARPSWALPVLHDTLIADRLAVEAAAAAAAHAAAIQAQKDRVNSDPVLKTIATELIRCAAVRQGITVAQARTALLAELDANIGT